jgi:hypothetical protein
MLTQSCFLFEHQTEKGIKLNERNEKMTGIAHSKCNKDIRIGVTAACKGFGMKITGRGSIAGCESSNLIDIPIICDVLQSIGLFEDSAFPNPSDRFDKAERAERKAARKAAAAAALNGPSTDSSNNDTKDVPLKEDELTLDKSTPHTASPGGKAGTSSNASSVTDPSVTQSAPTPRVTSTSSLESLQESQISNTELSSSSISNSTESEDKKVQKYAPNLIDIELILTSRWDHQLQDYLSDMQKRKTPYHYHAADGISAEGVAMVASYIPTPALTPKSTPKCTQKNSKNSAPMVCDEVKVSDEKPSSDSCGTNASDEMEGRVDSVDDGSN